MITGLAILEPFEIAVETHNRAWLGLLKNEEHHGWTIEFDLASHRILERKLRLLKHEVLEANWSEAIFDDCCDNLTMDPQVEGLLVVFAQTRIEGSSFETAVRDSIPDRQRS